VNDSNLIYRKLEDFIKKFYVNELIRGSLLFIGLGLLYFLFIIFIEYFLWLKPNGRTALFWLFVSLECYLLFRFIIFPLFKLFKLKKGIDHREAAIIIGDHFYEVKDKLLNFIQLSADAQRSFSSDLLLASIEQRALSLKPVVFSNAINFKANRKWLPLTILPLSIVAFLYVSDNSRLISQSFDRVIHFKREFLPPAPFKFVILNTSLVVAEDSDFTLRVRTDGSVVPDRVLIVIGTESYFLEEGKPGEFVYRFIKCGDSISFHLEGNGVESKQYNLEVRAVPTIKEFEMQLDFPSFLGRKREIVKGTGNAIVPEGTVVTWLLTTAATMGVELEVGSHFDSFVKIKDRFTLKKKIVQNIDYQVVTSNEQSKSHEKLKYQLTVVKDQFPSITVVNSPDSLKISSKYLVGQVGDDYGLSKLQVVYYDVKHPTVLQIGLLPIKKGVFDQFIFSFPGTFKVQTGIVYNYYFEVFDNDALHGFKSVRSSVFSTRISTEEENIVQIFDQQSDNIKGLQQSLKKQEKQLSQLDKLQKLGREKENFSYAEQQNVKDFIKQQNKQDEMMRDFTNKLKENIGKEKAVNKDEFKEALLNRIEKSNEDLDKNKKLLDELQALNDKINNEELTEKIEKFKQSSKSQVKNLEQLVELTKQYYVKKKAEQLADRLAKLGAAQDVLSETEKLNSLEKQKEINDSFELVKEDLIDLKKDNKQLKKPLDLEEDGTTMKSIDLDLGNAVDELVKGNNTKAKVSQKNAAGKMKAMSKKMASSMSSGEAEQMEEDVKMLRQILDNVLAFSLAQEAVMLDVRNLNSNSISFNKNIKRQQDLKMQFKHIDDSLFSMSLRNPKFTDNITKEIGNTQYNLDKSLESLVESKIAKGVSHQQYAIAASNKLGDFLSSILSNMQMELSGVASGKPKKGTGQGMQLPDIISKQQGLGDKLKDGGKKDSKSGEGKEGADKVGAGGDQEGDAQELLEIYKEQKSLREALEGELKKQGVDGVGKNAIDQMKLIEKDLLNKGFNKETLQKILNVKQELLKLKSAIQTQGEDSSRQSEVGSKLSSGQSKPLPDALLDYLKSIEILNRQSLPLRSNYNRKVQAYFNTK
jgi:molybdopterin-binding protein